MFPHDYPQAFFELAYNYLWRNDMFSNRPPVAPSRASEGIRFKTSTCARTWHASLAHCKIKPVHGRTHDMIDAGGRYTNRSGYLPRTIPKLPGGSQIWTEQHWSHRHLASAMPLKFFSGFEGCGRVECLRRALGKPPELWNAEQATAQPAGMRLKRWNTPELPWLETANETRQRCPKYNISGGKTKWDNRLRK